jgi:hypothetical protein
MVRKIIPIAGGWSKNAGGIDHRHPLFEQSATRTLAHLPTDAVTWRTAAIETLTRQLARRPLPPPILDAIAKAIVEVIDLEMPALPAPGPRPAIDAVTYRARLRSLLTFRSQADLLLRDWTAAIGIILGRIAAAVPDLSSDAAGFGITVPLIDLAPTPAELIADIVARTMCFAQGDALAVVPGAVIARRLKESVLRASNMTEDNARKHPDRLISPQQSGLVGVALAEAYLGGTPFFDLLTSPVPFAIPRRAFRAHGCVFGPSDHGKTQTLQAIVVGFLNELDPPALIIMDSMGAMLKKLQRLALFDERLKDRLIVLDPAGAAPPRLNFFKLAGGTPAQQMELLFYLFKALDQSLTARQRTTVTFLAHLMQRIDGTLDDLRHVCEAKQPQHLDAINTLAPIAREFFLNAFYKPDALMTQTKQQIAARLYTLASTPIFPMFSAKENTFNAFEAIQGKKIVLVNTDRLALGDDGSTIFGRFVLAQCLAAAFARAPIPEDERHLALCIVDEAKAYFDEQTERFLSDARQFGLGLLFGTQYVSQLPEGVRRAVYGNTAIKLIGPIEYSDRVSLAREMNTTPKFIGAMRSYDNSHTEWAAHVRTSNMTPSAIKLTVPFGILERMPRSHHPSAPASPDIAVPPRSEQPYKHAKLVEPQITAATPDQPLIKPGKAW